MTRQFLSALVSALIVLAVGISHASAQVPYRRIEQAASTPADWLTYSGNYNSQRYSALNQINRGNVAQLRPAWMYQLKRPGVFETSPVVADGVMYITEPPSTVTALDVRTGRPLWTWTPAIPSDVIVIGSPPVNRGVAILDDMVFAGSIAGHLTALDIKSGAVRWDIVVDDNKKGYYLTLAPLALDGKIVVGVSGAEAGIRGFIAAYEPKTGKQLWRTYTIPGVGEPGRESWGKDSANIGGSSTWLTGSYDPALNTLYWVTGNPGPDYDGDVRPGDNLYTCAVLAIDPNTGRIKWHFQFTPHDVHDWDSNQIPILFDDNINGRPRKLIAVANRNAFYYLLDRETGEFISGTPYAKQTWANGLDAKGRPILRAGNDPSIAGTTVFPNLQGSANWYSPSYSPQTKLFYQFTREMSTIYYKGQAKYTTGQAYTAGGGTAVNGDDAYAAIRALEGTTGKLRWEFKLLQPGMDGVLSTAGGLVFSGTEEGNFFALDAENGKPLWDMQLGGPVHANPMSFGIGGKQYVAIAAGWTLYVFTVP
ncbi:MAG TPA: PQQ-dependent dehydrogenase, methanol/ethanol family [Micropepsaceae bacterium]|nr:PQQ-dependent dehydrogenase, methanol/ethanol family [Micropepsaceae bacterium]